MIFRDISVSTSRFTHTVQYIRIQKWVILKVTVSVEAESASFSMKVSMSNLKYDESVQSALSFLSYLPIIVNIVPSYIYKFEIFLFLYFRISLYHIHWMYFSNFFSLFSWNFCLFLFSVQEVHCKEKKPKLRNKYFQKRNCAVTVPISTFLCLWANYIFPRSICLCCYRKICEPILGIYKSLTDKWMWKLGLRPRNSQKRST